jgi:hypothetical protein
MAPLGPSASLTPPPPPGSIKPQAAANVAYSLGVADASWLEFPPDVQRALKDAVLLLGDALSTQVRACNRR